MALPRRVGALSASAIMALGVIVPAAAVAGDYCPPPPPPPAKKANCNAGNGNGSDVATFVEGAHCYGGDPGNSFNAGNRGGDEVTVTSPGGVSSVSNPGGNNVPPLP